ncbi:DoxX family protein [Belliella sp. DSM 111904]|uniref:DoxX family protein n=1 Tax=Belliella filtrata TaxID=2923435 RepID=A0ABS9UXH3_9BACT|nr:DoxX family protein [Belliella filtrata]MCH7408763.1 DoxX family protein [Belliella filtrata]
MKRVLIRLDSIHQAIRSNFWHWCFYLFCRLSLAIGFLIAGMVKIMGERFASGLSDIHPMGSYLEALFHTGYYYTFIGVAQVLAAVMLLIPRAVLAGALLYMSIIFNIWILSLAVRFEGSLVSSTLMVLATLYLICYHFDQFKWIFSKSNELNLKLSIMDRKFPLRFFFASLMAIVLVVYIFTNLFEIMPRNSMADCESQFTGTENEAAGFRFCKCVHLEGNALSRCLEQYEEGK